MTTSREEEEEDEPCPKARLRRAVMVAVGLSGARKIRDASFAETE
jgi:hypothetical protein